MLSFHANSTDIEKKAFCQNADWLATEGIENRVCRDQPLPSDMKMRMALKTTITPAIRFGASDPLQYSPKYSLLICREYQYAIQKKNALTATRFDTKSTAAIYNVCRPPSLKKWTLSSLILCPCPLLFRHPSMPSLPILSGYRRTAAKCRRFTTSSRRMKSHQIENHDLSALVPLSVLLRPSGQRSSQSTAAPKSNNSRSVRPRRR